MPKLLTALKRTFADAPYTEPTVHFHASSRADFPEVCYDGACERPQLAA